MRDHKDVAQKVTGRWERMVALRNKISAIEKERFELIQAQEELRVAYDESKETQNEAEEVLKDYQAGDADSFDLEMHNGLKEAVEGRSKDWLSEWEEANKEKLERMEESVHSLQRELKRSCAKIRNEYSTSQLQSDFKAGLEELVRKPDEEEVSSAITTAAPKLDAIPDDFQLAVHCVSANDYLKILNIKPSSDGSPNTFVQVRCYQDYWSIECLCTHSPLSCSPLFSHQAVDAGIPALREFVHNITAKARTNFSENYVNVVSDLIDRVKLVAGDVKGATTGGRTARRSKSVFDEQMDTVDAKVKQIVNDFLKNALQKVQNSLTPSLQNGAAKGQAEALTTVNSWGSSRRRSRQHRDPENNGLYVSFECICFEALILA